MDRQTALCSRLFGFGLSITALLISAPSLVWGDTFSSATYRAVFEATWTAETHPTGFPSNPHFSPIIGAAHNAEATFWMSGEMASPGLEQVAEMGSADTLMTEVETQIGMGNALAVVRENPPTPNTGTVTIEFEFSVNDAFPLVTLATMIAPSPDWFVGVSGLSLQDDEGQWMPEHQVDLFPYDAGTEDGTLFSVDNPETTPRGSIMSVRGVAPFSEEPMATLTFERLHREEFDAYLEQPLEGPVAGIGLVRGWAFSSIDSAPIDIELLIDGAPVFDIPAGSERDDVAEAFPDEMNASDSGFGLVTNYGLFEPGPHGLTVRGTSAMGAQFSITRQITVKQFGGLEFADLMLSGAALSLDGETLVIDGAKVSSGVPVLEDRPDTEKTQTISLRWSKEAQGFVVADIMDQ